MNILMQHLKDVHTDGDGTIKIDSDEEALRLSVELMQEEQSTDVDIMVEQL